MLKNPYGKLTVAIADPTPHLASLVTQMLRTLGVRRMVTVATTPMALATLKARRFDIVLVDDKTDKWDGVELTRRLRADTEGASHGAAVIMMSSAPDAARIKAARDAGITEFLRRPFSAQHIESRLKSILEAPRDFIAVEGYVGPDRRRHHDEYRGNERRIPDSED